MKIIWIILPLLIYLIVIAIARVLKNSLKPEAVTMTDSDEDIDNNFNSNNAIMEKNADNKNNIKQNKNLEEQTVKIKKKIKKSKELTSPSMQNKTKIIPIFPFYIFNS